MKEIESRSETTRLREQDEELGNRGEVVGEIAFGENGGSDRFEGYDYDVDTVRIYYEQIREIPLLNKDKEKELAILVEGGRNAREMLEIHGDQINDYVRRQCELNIQKGEAAAKDLVVANTRWVVTIAKTFMGCGLDLPDLIQVGNLGLMKAVEKFDYRKGRLSTYSAYWIRQAIYKEIGEQSRTIRVPNHLGEKISKVNQSGQFQLSEEQLAEIIEANIERLRQILGYQRMQPISLDGDDSGDGVLADTIGDYSLGPEEEMEQQELKKLLELILNELDERGNQVLRLRFGWDGGDENTLKEVAEKFQITEERVRQIQMDKLRKLKKLAEVVGLGEYSQARVREKKGRKGNLKQV